MFTGNDLRALVKVQPFVPCRLVLSNGGTVDVRTPEVVSPGRHRI